MNYLLIISVSLALLYNLIKKHLYKVNKSILNVHLFFKFIVIKHKSNQSYHLTLFFEICADFIVIKI